MFHRILRYSVLCMCALGLSALPVAAAKTLTPTPDGRANIPTLPPTLIKQLTATTTRDKLITTLLANPATKQVLSEEATKAGIAPANLGSLVNTPLQAKLAPKVIAAAGAALDYANIDWSAGVFFNPLNPPKYGKDGMYNLGEYTLNFATLRTQEPNTVRYRLDAPDENVVIQYYIAELQLELPTGPSTYAIALNLSTPDGISPAEWLDLKQEAPYLFAFMYVGYKRYDVVLTPLVGQPGYAGIISVDPKEQPKGQDSKMRATTAELRVAVSLGKNLPEVNGMAHHQQSLIFGGLTLTRL